MRLATFRDAADAIDTRIGVVRGERIVDVARAALLAGEEPPAELREMQALIAAGEAGLRRVAALLHGAPEEAELPLASVELLAPLPRPRKNVFCLGRNYAEHAAESLRAAGQEVRLADYPNVFTKAPTAITGPYADIPYDASVTPELDWEVELAVVIGRAGRHIAKDDALAYVWGYTVLNDVSERDFNRRMTDRKVREIDPFFDWLMGKWFDGFCPLGPEVVSAEEIPDPHSLAIKLWVNGQLMQDANTSQMIFGIPQAISYISQVLTLEPGDIIAMGTPAGVGKGRGICLKAGDTMRGEIEGIGVLETPVIFDERTRGS